MSPILNGGYTQHATSVSLAASTRTPLPSPTPRKGRPP